jgi:hypothetical protein
MEALGVTPETLPALVEKESKAVETALAAIDEKLKEAE